jgi:DNA-binding protein H-NS
MANNGDAVLKTRNIHPTRGDDMTTYRELKAKAGELLKQADKLRNKEVKAVIAEIRARMAEYDITVDDLKAPAKRATKARAKAATGKPRKAKAASVKPKYRNPDTGATWTGRGKPPGWIKEAEAQGKGRDGFLIG